MWNLGLRISNEHCRYIMGPEPSCIQCRGTAYYTCKTVHHTCPEPHKAGRRWRLIPRLSKQGEPAPGATTWGQGLHSRLDSKLSLRLQMPFLSRIRSKQLGKAHKTQYIPHLIILTPTASTVYWTSFQWKARKEKEKWPRPLAPPQGSFQGHCDWSQISHNSLLCCCRGLNMEFPLPSFYTLFT